MSSDAPPPAHQSATPRLIVLAVCAAFVIGAIVLCARGGSLVIKDYDGILSWFNYAAAADCLGGVILAVIALVIGIVAAVSGRKSAL